ncbi:MAG: cation-translocating P-type ATPase, partial [Burkholderiaceae bacterium]|nr:cation-translocating P-type ATPase [Burkholderiaceae bacterium]
MTAASLTEAASTDLDIGGMTCAACAGRVERALRAVPGVTEASVNLATERARVRGAVSADDLVAAVSGAGYEAQVASDETAGPTVVEPEFWEGPGPVWIAAALSVPLVLPMIAGWFGADWMLPAWMQWLLATPVQFVVGARFYK